MSIFHLSVKTISRSEGRSATSAAAYRAADKIKDIRTGELFDYTKKRGVLANNIFVPKGEKILTREELWNAAESAEKRRNSTVAREYEIAIPIELKKSASYLAQQFANYLVNTYGVVADVCLHAPNRKGDQRNIHAHILTTTRQYKSGSLQEKTRILDDKKSGANEIIKIRKQWENICNAYLDVLAPEASIDCRSNDKQGKVEKAPTIHLGHRATALERKGIRTERGDYNRNLANFKDFKEETLKNYDELVLENKRLEARLNSMREDYRKATATLPVLQKEMKDILEKKEKNKDTLAYLDNHKIIDFFSNSRQEAQENLIRLVDLQKDIEERLKKAQICVKNYLGIEGANKELNAEIDRLKCDSTLCRLLTWRKIQEELKRQKERQEQEQQNRKTQSRTRGWSR